MPNRTQPCCQYCVGERFLLLMHTAAVAGMVGEKRMSLATPGRRIGHAARPPATALRPLRRLLASRKVVALPSDRCMGLQDHPDPHDDEQAEGQQQPAKPTACCVHINRSCRAHVPPSAARISQGVAQALSAVGSMKWAPRSNAGRLRLPKKPRPRRYAAACSTTSHTRRRSIFQTSETGVLLSVLLGVVLDTLPSGRRRCRSCEVSGTGCGRLWRRSNGSRCYCKKR